MLAEIQKRDTALQGVNDNLTTRTRELEREVAERLRAQEELKTLNATLELRVAERSAAAEQRALQLARSEEAHQKQSRILQSILDSMSDGVIVADDAGQPDPRQPGRRDDAAVRWRARAARSVGRPIRLLPARYCHAVSDGTVPTDAGRPRARRSPTSKSSRSRTVTRTAGG